ncbi:MAG: ZIP family metal transporter [Deltaproteobacteria bacterium]|nr:ZIP family metal transporter [Deltaproteobacteria bacterium]
MIYVLCLAIFFATFIGGAIPLVRTWKQIRLHQFIGFGAGILLGTCFLFMVPEATESLGGLVGIGILIGFLCFYFLEKFMMVHACTEVGCELHDMGLPIFIGFSLHSLVDGVALGSSFLVPSLMPIVFFALLAHHGPTSFAFTSILKVAGYTWRKMFAALCLFSVMIPLSALTTHFSLVRVSNEGIGWVIAFSAGIFLHIATCDILPEIHTFHKKNIRNLWAFTLGLLIMTSLYFFFDHAH